MPAISLPADHGDLTREICWRALGIEIGTREEGVESQRRARLALVEHGAKNIVNLLPTVPLATFAGGPRIPGRRTADQKQGSSEYSQASDESACHGHLVARCVRH